MCKYLLPLKTMKTYGKKNQKGTSLSSQDKFDKILTSWKENIGTPLEMRTQDKIKEKMAKPDRNVSKKAALKAQKLKCSAKKSCNPNPRSRQIGVGKQNAEPHSDSDSSIELPRRDLEVSWKEKISLLLPKMDMKQAKSFHSPKKHIQRTDDLKDFLEAESDEEYTWVTENCGNRCRQTKEPETSHMTKKCEKSSLSDEYTYTWATATPSDNRQNHANNKWISSTKDHSHGYSDIHLITRKLNSTAKENAKIILEANFPSDISNIEKVNCNGQDDFRTFGPFDNEVTPSTKKVDLSTIPHFPCKQNQENKEQKKKFQPKSSTVLFKSQNADLPDFDFGFSSVAENITREKAGKFKEKTSPTVVFKEPKKVLTSTPTLGKRQVPLQFEEDLTSVPPPSPCEDELELNESREVNSMEIVPDDTVLSVPLPPEPVSAPMEVEGGQELTKKKIDVHVDDIPVENEQEFSSVNTNPTKQDKNMYSRQRSKKPLRISMFYMSKNRNYTQGDDILACKEKECKGNVVKRGKNNSVNYKRKKGKNIENCFRYDMNNLKGCEIKECCLTDPEFPWPCKIKRTYQKAGYP